ncbi:MAG: hypothetical protein IE914_06145 [Thiotrichales bacterium]|nr:hypothetical protein [Thiotrichales bacterium]
MNSSIPNYSEMDLNAVQQAVDPSIPVALYSIWAGIAERGITCVREYLVHCLLVGNVATPDHFKALISRVINRIYPNDFESLEHILIPFYFQLVDLFCNQAAELDTFKTWAYNQYLKGLEVAANA